MVLRLGSFNVENLFKRAKALNTATWSEGEPVLIAFERFNALANRGVFRKGLWGDPGNVNPPQAWEIYPEITASVHAASDHAAIWVDLDL
jgi:hypothetical protein